MNIDIQCILIHIIRHDNKLELFKDYTTKAQFILHRADIKFETKVVVFHC